MSKLNEARSKLFNSKAYKGPTVDVDIEGVLLEVRAPRVRHGMEGLSTGKLKPRSPDIGEIFIDCVYLKETGEPFFTKEYIAQLEECSAHEEGIVNRLSKAIEEVSSIAVDVKKTKKN